MILFRFVLIGIRMKTTLTLQTHRSKGIYGKVKPKRNHRLRRACSSAPLTPSFIEPGRASPLSGATQQQQPTKTNNPPVQRHSIHHTQRVSKDIYMSFAFTNERSISVPKVDLHPILMALLGELSVWLRNEGIILLAQARHPP